MRVDAHITRTGVFEYRDHQTGAIRREYRPPDEVFHQDSLDSFAGRAVTDDHPDGPVTAENATAVARGTLGDTVRRDGDHVAASMMILDAKLVKKVQAGKVQVSCGYSCDLDETPGVTPQGERYDAIQRNIRGNHVAIVDVGRAGPTARIRMDAAEMIDTTTKDSPMEELQKMLAAALADAANQRLRADTAEKARDEANGKLAATEAKLKDAESQRTDSATIEKMVDARVALRTEAAPVLGADFKMDGKSDRDIKVAVLEKAGVKVPADASPGFIDGAYAVALGNAQRADASHASVRTVVQGGNRVDASAPTGDVEEAARQKMISASAKAWEPKTPASN